MTDDFPKAVPVPRGCGQRERGGVYFEVGLSRHGLPFDWFLLCPPKEPPEGLDLINKPVLWSPEPEEENPLYHVLIWVGEEFYPAVTDFIEEARRFGISRRIRGNFEFDKLTPGKSRLVLVHPKVINGNWQKQTPPDFCPRENRFHLETQELAELPLPADPAEAEGLQIGLPEPGREVAVDGPCLGKLYQLLPVPEGQQPGEIAFREMPSFRYSYTPTGEEGGELRPGIFGIFPITGLALVKREDGTVNEEAELKIQKAGFNYYLGDA